MLPGLHLGPPGTTPRVSCCSANSSSSSAASSNGGTARAGSRATDAPRASHHHHHQQQQQQQQQQQAQAQAQAPGPDAAAAGCCAPSFAVGLLVALLYKGRFPEEYEAQWAACPRLKVRSTRRAGVGGACVQRPVVVVVCARAALRCSRPQAAPAPARQGMPMPHGHMHAMNAGAGP
jgi:hypothetical protein